MRTHRAMKKIRSERGVSLIVVVFVIMLLGVMGWALMSMQSVDFEMSWRNLDSERALDVAEAGLQEALNRIYTNSADFNNDTRILNRTLESGQYVVSRTTVNANISVLSTGYVPAQANYRAMRQLRMLVIKGSMDKVVQAHNRFDWAGISGSSSFNGTIQAAFYNGDDSLPDNQQASDIAAIPRTGSSPAPIVAATPYPRIDMAAYQQAAATGGTVWTPLYTSTIKKVSTVAGKTQLELDDNQFLPAQSTDFVGNGLRNISRGHLVPANRAVIEDTSGRDRVKLDRQVDWAVGERVTVLPKILSSPALTYNAGARTMTFSVFGNFEGSLNEALRNVNRATDNWEYREWGRVTAATYSNSSKKTSLTVQILDNTLNIAAHLWSAGEWLSPAKLYDDTFTVNQDIVYIQADTIFDVRNFISAFRGTSIISEGDIGIRGDGLMLFSQRPDPYPALATQNGNISSPDLPNWILRLLGLGRVFDTLIYSENGDIAITFLYGTAIVGNNITLKDRTVMNYNSLIAQAPYFIMDMVAGAWQDE